MAGGRYGVVEQQVMPLVQRALAEESRRAEPHPGPAVPGAPAVPSARATSVPSPGGGSTQVCRRGSSRTQELGRRHCWGCALLA